MTGNCRLIGRNGNCLLRGPCLITSLPIAPLYNVFLGRFLAGFAVEAVNQSPPRGSHRDYFARVIGYTQK